MVNLVGPTGRQLWFLHDPIEDNPNRSWNDYRKNYECTVVASLMWPEVSKYEVMPWPDRIFNGKYPKLDMDTKSGEREGIPADYATQVLTVINALNEMNQKDVEREFGTGGIGVVISDTAMFQRADPTPSDRDLGFFYGLALPLLKAGIPVEPVQLENTPDKAALAPYRVLLMTYEGMKPLKREFHEAIEQWVRGGGGLIFVEDGSDPYHGVREWWNNDGKNGAKAYEDLLARLGAGPEARQKPQAVGSGFVRVVEESPSAWSRASEGPERARGLVREMLAAQGQEMRTQNYLKVRRGPYVVVSVLDESASDAPLRLTGRFVDVFDPKLPVLNEKVLQPDSRALLYDVDWASKHGLSPKVLAAGARIRSERATDGAFTFIARGPQGTSGNARILLPKEPSEVVVNPAVDVKRTWDAASSTLYLSFPNVAGDVSFRIPL